MVAHVCSRCGRVATDGVLPGVFLASGLLTRDALGPKAATRPRDALRICRAMVLVGDGLGGLERIRIPSRLVAWVIGRRFG